jgi:PKD repeat protein
VFARNQGGDDNWGEVKKLTASDGAAYDNFGVSVAIAGDTLVVGAFLDDDNGYRSGSAYVFARNRGGTNNWGEVKKLIASDGAAGDWFGFSVAMAGDTVVVGAYFDDDNGDDSGSAYVFARDQGGTDNWGEVKKLIASDGAAGDWFSSYAVAIAGDTIIVGAYGDDEQTGSAYVFARNWGGADNWGEVEKLIASDAAPGDRFGYSIAIAGDAVVVGAIFDDDKGYNSGSAYVYRPLNQPPVADAGGPYSVPEGGSVLLTGSGSDPDGDPLTYAWDLDNDGTFETPGQSVDFLAAGLDGPSSQAVALQVCDDKDACDTSSSEVNITNVAPTVGDITAPTEPVEVDTPIEASASFNDPGTMDTHTATWDWGDSTVEPIDPATSPTSASHTYTEPRVYTVRLTVTDDDGDSGESVFQYVVVYDPEGGFVTGGGWIDSPEGAYTPDPSLTGKATFGFVSKYKRGANVPTGQTEFQFKVANLNFHSDICDWLVVAGARAQFKGAGTINGEGQYKFMLTALDADINANDSFEVDRFRIRIWEEDEYGTETVVYYDNGLGADHDDDNATTEIGGGSIVIHKEK